MKYICVKRKGDNQIIFTFADTISHALMFNCISNNCYQRPLVSGHDKFEVVSAGFVTKKLQCFGDSQTLNVKSRGDVDSKILKNQFYL